jgi:protein SCO1
MRALAAVAMVVALSAAWHATATTSALPVFGPEDFNPRLVDTDRFGSRTTHRVGTFVATDQSGRQVTERDLDGRITVASFIFTHCSEICVGMVRQLKRVQAAYAADARVLLLSHSVDPERDTVATLRAFADARGLNAERWRLVTAPRATIVALARQSYFAVHNEAAAGATDYVHTETLVLVDGQRRLRGFYNGTLPHDVDQLIADIAALKKE